MSHVPTHEEIRAGAAAVDQVFEAHRRDPRVQFDGTFWHTGWLEWRRLVPNSDGVRAGDADAVEHAIVFLEADPWCFASGYDKQRVMRALVRVRLQATQIERLDAVLLALITHDRREVADAIRLARTHRGPRLKSALRSLLATSEDETALRALRALLAVRRPRLDDAARKRTRRLLERGSWWWIGLTDDEVRRATAACWDESWGRDLVRPAVHGPENVAMKAIWLLVMAPVVRIDVADRPALVEPILRALEPGDYRALKLARPAWCPEMEAALFELLGSDDHALTDAVAELLDELSTQ